MSQFKWARSQFLLHRPILPLRMAVANPKLGFEPAGVEQEVEV